VRGSIYIYLVAIYFLIWWLVWFAVLPWGVRRTEEPAPGHDPGAPARPLIGRKLIATTLISAMILAAGYTVWMLEVLEFERWPLPFALPR
jgi:predicted secreted protein